MRRRRRPGSGAVLGRSVGVLLLVASLLSACSGRADDIPEPTQPPPLAGRCDGVRRADVVGTAPAYLDAGIPLARYANDQAVCRAVWLPRLDGQFVPQGLAVEGHTAWVSGYRWRPGYGHRSCQLVHVDLRTGRQLGFQRRLDAALPGTGRVTCKHGGGLRLDQYGLWVAETKRLWLVDPERVGTSSAVQRVWRLTLPVSGGSVIAGPAGTFALTDFRDAPSVSHRFRVSEVVDPAARTLVARSPASPREVAARRVDRAPAYAQGGALPRGRTRPFLVSSLTRCGVLATPSGRQLAFAPGAEGIALDGRLLWTVSESGSRPFYEEGDRPLTPTLLGFDRRELLRGHEAECGW